MAQRSRLGFPRPKVLRCITPVQPGQAAELGSDRLELDLIESRSSWLLEAQAEEPAGSAAQLDARERCDHRRRDEQEDRDTDGNRLLPPGRGHVCDS